jgi:EAL domain-containing protein (putative c-di-GMP-specific phosphodiesterase class I)
VSWPKDVSVSVNLSTRQIDEGDIFTTVRDALAASGLEPQRLELEITETAVMRNPEHARRVLEKLHRLGVSLALDDFGTCFSNLSYVRDLPVNALKIDKSFVQDAAEREGSRTILRSVADLATRLGMQAVAEGVETEANLSAVRESGCSAAQGFYFSLPVPRSAVLRTLGRCRQRLEASKISRAA